MGRGGLIDYVNIPRMLGMIVSSRLATMHELKTVYGLEAAYDLSEIVSVDRYNLSRPRE